MPDLAPLTTLRLGGPAGRLVEATDEPALVEAVRTDAAPLVLAGGSNVVIADDGVPGTVVLVRTAGIEREGTRLTVAAGESWDELVAMCVAEGLAGFECLSGIPGSVGATPIQNVGAYGQEVAETVRAVRVLDRASGEISELGPQDCGFGYRTSAFKRDPDRWLVLAVSFDLRADPEGGRVRYAELAEALGVEPGSAAPLSEVREAVLALRRGKGMVIDPGDPDSVSAGSFFTNPILDRAAYDALVERSDSAPPGWPEPGGRVKTSAAWLIEQAGFTRGHGHGDVGISTKHTLALVNRGAGTTAELVALAREIAARVEREFGVALTPEPVFVGHSWT